MLMSNQAMLEQFIDLTKEMKRLTKDVKKLREEIKEMNKTASDSLNSDDADV